MTLILFLPSQLCAFQAFSLPLLSHHPFPSIFVVGPPRSLLSPGLLVTNKQTCLLYNAQAVPDFLLQYDNITFGEAPVRGVAPMLLVHMGVAKDVSLHDLVYQE